MEQAGPVLDCCLVAVAIFLGIALPTRSPLGETRLRMCRTSLASIFFLYYTFKIQIRSILTICGFGGFLHLSVEFKQLFVEDLDEDTVVNPNATVSCRTLALEHAQHRLTFFLEELPCACIREAPQLPVVWQIPWTLRDPRFKQKIPIPSLLVIRELPVTRIADKAVHVKGKPIEKLSFLGDHRRARKFARMNLKDR